MSEVMGVRVLTSKQNGEQGPILSTWMSNHMHSKVQGVVTYQFPNFNGYTVEVLEWIGNFISYFTDHVISNSCQEQISCQPHQINSLTLH